MVFRTEKSLFIAPVGLSACEAEEPTGSSIPIKYRRRVEEAGGFAVGVHVARVLMSPICHDK